MSKEYELFKKLTLDAATVINKANKIKAVDDEYERGFENAMYEAREIFMRVEDEMLKEQS